MDYTKNFYSSFIFQVNEKTFLKNRIEALEKTVLEQQKLIDELYIKLYDELYKKLYSDLIENIDCIKIEVQ